MSEPNPIGEKYAEIASSFLEGRKGQPVDDRMIGYISGLLAATTCELVGVGEAAAIVGVSKQRINQLEERMPSKAGEVKATPLWLASDIKDFAIRRKGRRS